MFVVIDDEIGLKLAELCVCIRHGNVAQQNLRVGLFHNLVDDRHDNGAHGGGGADGDDPLLVVAAVQVQRPKNRLQTLADILMKMRSIGRWCDTLTFTNKKGIGEEESKFLN